MAKFCKLVLLTLCGTAIATSESGDHKDSGEYSSQSLMERISIYQSSIKRWDTQNADLQRDIIKQLAEEPQTRNPPPGCPRIRFPMVCDDAGVLLENVCYFKMRRRERQGTLPVLVFTSTPIDQARAMCEKEIRKP